MFRFDHFLRNEFTHTVKQCYFECIPKFVDWGLFRVFLHLFEKCTQFPFNSIPVCFPKYKYFTMRSAYPVRPNINFRIIYDIMVRFAKWRHGDNILEGGFIVGEK